MATAKPSSMEIPYIGKSGRPYHRLPAAQQRWYTKGKMSEEDAAELSMFFETVEERVRYYQSERVAIRGKSVKLLQFSESTPLEERQRKLDEVDGLRKTYQECLDNIIELKSMVIEFTPNEPLTLPPIE